MNDLRELYQEIILDHNKSPRNFGAPDDANHHAHGNNPLCGDKVTVHVTVMDGKLRDIGFQGRGCAISMASASMMTELVKGKSQADAEALFEQFHDLLTGKLDTPPATEEGDRLAVLAGVRDYPMRVKCATLAWHTLKAALNNPVQSDPEVTTEHDDGYGG